MALVLPIPQNALLVTDQDLGRGFSIDENGEKAKKSNVFIPSDIKPTLTHVDSNSLTLIKDEETLKSALGVSGEVSLSYGLISGKVLGSYVDNSSSSSQKLTFLFNRNIVKKIIQLDIEKLKTISGFDQIDSIESLRNDYGGYYISKIEYGAVLELKITLESNDSDTINELKGELSGSVEMGKLKVAVQGQIDKRSGNTKKSLNVTSTVYMAGCKPIKDVAVTSLEKAQTIIDTFEVDETRLVPLRIEISQIPPVVLPKLKFDDMELRSYKNKLTQIGSNFWQLNELITSLTLFSDLLKTLDDDLVEYVYTLGEKIEVMITDLQKLQEDTVNFMQDTFKNIISKPIAQNTAFFNTQKKIAEQLVGSKSVKTEKGWWFGPIVDGIPTYTGTYKLNNETVYKGLCLEGKRHGKGELSYPEGNAEGIKVIEGKWKNDELSFPSTITFADDTVRKISNLLELQAWNDSKNSGSKEE